MILIKIIKLINQVGHGFPILLIQFMVLVKDHSFVFSFDYPYICGLLAHFELGFSLQIVDNKVELIKLFWSKFCTEKRKKNWGQILLSQRVRTNYLYVLELFGFPYFN